MWVLPQSERLCTQADGKKKNSLIIYKKSKIVSRHGKVFEGKKERTGNVMVGRKAAAWTACMSEFESERRSVWPGLTLGNDVFSCVITNFFLPGLSAAH